MYFNIRILTYFPISIDTFLFSKSKLISVNIIVYIWLTVVVKGFYRKLELLL